MMALAAFALTRIDVNRDFRQRGQRVKKFAPHGFRDAMAGQGGQLAIDGDMQFRALPVAQPAHGHVVYR